MAVSDDDEVPVDTLASRARRVRSAVDELVHALGPDGACFRRHVEAWAGGLDRSARTLPAFPPKLKHAGHRLTGLAAQMARNTFYRDVEGVRRTTSLVARSVPMAQPSRACTLSAAVRALPHAILSPRVGGDEVEWLTEW